MTREENDLIAKLKQMILHIEQRDSDISKAVDEYALNVDRGAPVAPGEICPTCKCRKMRWPKWINAENGHVVEW